MEWHCTAFWDHALNYEQITHSNKTLKKLEKAISIPIWLNKNEKEYINLAKSILSI